jgi:heat shock protein HslJ
MTGPLATAALGPRASTSMYPRPMPTLSTILAALLLVACSPAASPTGSPAPGGTILAGTNWSLRSIGGTDVSAGVSVTLDLSADQASGTSGCNQYGGSYTLDGNAIAFGPMAVTEMACPDPQMAVEAAYLAALTAASTWAIPADAPVGTQLTISGPDPASHLIFGPPA